MDKLEIIGLYNKGFSYDKIAEILNISKSTVAYYIRMEAIENKNEILKETENKKKLYEELVCNTVKYCYNYNQLCQLLNKRATNTTILGLKKIIEKNNVDTSHFKQNEIKCRVCKKYSYEDIFKENSEFSPSKLLPKFLAYTNKERKCEGCGKSTIVCKGKEYAIPLQVHHINGIRTDHRVENLEILCPTCHALTDNYAGKNIKKEKKEKVKINKERKTKCPSMEQLLEDYKEFGGYLGISKKYGVSDNAVKKWFKKYTLPYKVKEIRQYIIELFGKQEHWYNYRKNANHERTINKLGKKVIMLNKDGSMKEFKTINEASRYTGINAHTISRMCNGIKTKICDISFKFKT